MLRTIHLPAIDRTVSLAAYNQAGDKEGFCRNFLSEVEGGAMDAFVRRFREERARGV